MTNVTGLPLYKTARESNAWRNSRDMHCGLVFNKFGDAWTKGEFEKSEWLKSFVKRKAGNTDQIEDHLARQDTFTRAMKGRVICFKNESRFVAGMGLEHPLENGMVWHHTLGVPYLPASSLKGILRAWYRENRGEFVPPLPLGEGRGEGAQKKTGKWIECPKTNTLFGSSKGDGIVGEFIILDLLPAKPVTLTVEIMTPHYGDYYSKKAIPGDWHNPIPIPFLAVEKKQQWQTAIFLRTSDGTEEERKEKLDEIVRMLSEALSWLGAGAKTAVGYGRFNRDKNREDRKEEEVQRQLEEEERKKAQSEKDSALSEDVRELAVRSRNEKWFVDQNPRKFIDGMNAYLDEHEKVSQQILDWVRDEAIEFFKEKAPKKWKGVWEDPEGASTSKKKSKEGGKLVMNLKKALEHK